MNRRIIILFSALLVCLIALISIIGWLISNAYLVSFIERYPTLKFNTAICFLLSSVIIYLFLKRRMKSYILLLNVFLISLAGLTLSQDIFGVNYGIDEWIVNDRFSVHSTPGRMSQATATCFLGLGLAFLFLLYDRTRHLGQNILHIVTFICFTSLLAYGLLVPVSLRPDFFASMSASTSIGFVLLSIGGALVHPNHGIIKFFLGDFMGSKVARSLFPSFAVVSLILGSVLIWAIQERAVSLDFGIIIFMTSFIFIGIFLISKTAKKLNEIDEDRTREIADRVKTEKWFESIIEASPSAMIAVNDKGEIALANRESEYLFGYEGKELVGQPVSILVPDRLREQHPTYMQNFRAKPSKRRMGEGRELHCVRKDGKEIPVEIGLKPIEMADELFVLATIIDIRERKQKESIELRNKELIIHQRELEQFNYIASHDLQEPLRTISNYIQVLDEDFGTELHDDAKHYLKTIEKATARMRTLVLSLLEHSRLNKDLIKKQVNTQEIITEVIEDIESLIHSTKSSVTAKNLPTVGVYEVEFRLLIQNLITNGIKFRKPDETPVIEIDCEKDHLQWVFSVKDNGIGIEPEYFQRIFIAFQRLHSNKEYEGSGIGLANCKKIIDMHGGRIWVESTLGEGSTFYFTIPSNDDEKN